MLRRSVAAGGALLVLILAIVGIKGCLASQHRAAVTHYDHEAGALAERSDDEVGRPLFAALSSQAAAAQGGNAVVAVESRINQLRVGAQGLLAAARALGVPGDMVRAQASLLLVLELRSEAIAKIADQLPTALGSTDAHGGVTAIAAEMQSFLASDVIYASRVVPFIEQALTNAGVQGVPVGPSRFLTDLRWLSPTYVAGQLGVSASTPTGSAPPAPGTHGHRLVSVGYDGTALAAGTTTQLRYSSGGAFAVTLQNTGQNNESNVTVTVAIAGAGSVIQLRRSGIQTQAGQTTTITLTLDRQPAIGVPLQITAAIQRVPGEQSVVRNSGTFPVVFANG